MVSVSIIIPCYNYGRFLTSSAESALSQPRVDVQVLIIDDSSEDDTPQVGAQLATDPRVTFRRHEQNLGHIETINEGLEWATGDYSMVLSADDLLAPGALARATGVMEAHAEVGMVYGRSLYFESDDAIPQARSGVARPRIWDGSDWIARRCRTATNCISSPEVVVRTSLQKELGGYRADLPHTGDLEMWLRFAAHAHVAYLRGVDQALYRIHPSSMMRTTFASPVLDLQQRKRAFDTLFASYGSRIRDSARLQRESNRALAREALWGACRAYDRRRLDQMSVDDLESFARTTYRHATSLPEFRGLRWRRRVGPRWCPWIQPLLVSAVAHHTRDWLWWRRWNLSGV